MVRKTLLIGLGVISMVVILGAETHALTLPSGYTFSTKGVKCDFKIAGVKSDEINLTLGVCNVTNIQGAIVFCTNKPDSGFPQGSAFVEFVEDFTSGAQLVTDQTCDRRGNCKLSPIANGDIGGPCPFKPQQWTILDVVPVSFTANIQAVQCFDTFGNLTDCNSEGVFVVIQDEETAQCQLPNPNSFKFGQSKQYSCITQ